MNEIGVESSPFGEALAVLRDRTIHIQPQMALKLTPMRANAMATAAFAIIAVILVGAVGYVSLSRMGTSSSSSNTLTTSIQPCQTDCGVLVQGTVTVGPATPVCTAGLSCNVNVTGYQIGFDKYPNCAPLNGACPQYVIAYTAILDSNGHYSISLLPGNYTVAMPNCNWLGCSNVFPAHETFVAGTYTVNFDIDTGIR
jgi:hypothetical protein